MSNDDFSIFLQESKGLRVWEMDEIPHPTDVNCDTAHYRGQKNVEHLLKVINKKAFMYNEERYLDPLFSIFESSLERGVEDEGTIQWNDRSHYTRISWTGYSWKLPPDLKKRMVQIDISKLGEDDSVSKIRISIRKLADDGGDILISSKIISKLNLKKGNAVTVKIRFCH